MTATAQDETNSMSIHSCVAHLNHGVNPLGTQWRFQRELDHSRENGRRGGHLCRLRHVLSRAPLHPCNTRWLFITNSCTRKISCHRYASKSSCRQLSSVHEPFLPSLKRGIPRSALSCRATRRKDYSKCVAHIISGKHLVLTV